MLKMEGGSVAGIYRLKGSSRENGSAAPWSVVLKILHQWEREGDPGSWRREADIYRSTLYENLPKGLCVPKCYEMEEKEGEFRLWLEDVVGRMGKQLRRGDYRLACHLLGRYQGAYMAGGNLPEDGWLAPLHWREAITGEYREKAIKRVTAQEFEDCSSHKKLAEMRDRLLKLIESQELFHREVEGLPRTLAHRDFHPDNLFARTRASGEKEVVLLDWDCAGIGVVGEDIGDMIAEVLVYFGRTAKDGPGLYELVFPEYLAGLREAGWDGSPDLVRSGILANWGVHWCFRITSYVLHNPQLEDCDRLADVVEWLMGKALRLIQRD